MRGTKVNCCHRAYQRYLECHTHFGCSLVHDNTSVVSRWSRVWSSEILLEGLAATEIIRVGEDLWDVFHDMTDKGR